MLYGSFCLKEFHDIHYDNELFHLFSETINFMENNREQFFPTKHEILRRIKYNSFKNRVYLQGHIETVVLL